MSGVYESQEINRVYMSATWQAQMNSIPMEFTFPDLNIIVKIDILSVD